MVCGPCVAQFSQSGLRLGPTRWSRLVDAWVSTEDLAAGRARPILTWTRIGQLAGGWGRPRQARWCRNDPRIGPRPCHESHRSRLCLGTYPEPPAGNGGAPGRRPPGPATSLCWSQRCLSPGRLALRARVDPSQTSLRRARLIPEQCEDSQHIWGGCAGLVPLGGCGNVTAPRGLSSRQVYSGLPGPAHEHEAGSMEDR